MLPPYTEEANSANEENLVIESKGYSFNTICSLTLMSTSEPTWKIILHYFFLNFLLVLKLIVLCL